MKRFTFLIICIGLMASMGLFAGGQQSASEAQTTLVYWSMWNQTETQGQVLTQAIRDFEQQNPGVRVQVNWNGREIRQTLQPALDQGVTIDLWDEDLERVILTWGNYALKLDPFFEQSYPTTNNQPYKDVVMGSLLDLARNIAPDGALYAVPYQPFVFNMMYNKSHFQQAGIQQVPRTWAEFMDAMAKLKAAGFEPMTIDNAYMDTLPGYYLARAKGPEWVAQLVSDRTNAMWDDPAVLQMARAFEEMATKGYFSRTVESNVWPAGQQDLAAGTVSMYLNGTWLVNEIMNTTGPDFPWGTFAFPEVPGGVTGRTAANYGSQAFQINKNSAHPELAFKLAVHLTTGRWDEELAKRTFGVPVGGTTDWPVQLADARAIFNSLDTHYPWAGGIQANPEKLPVIIENFTRLIAGRITADQFVNNLKR